MHSSLVWLSIIAGFVSEGLWIYAAVIRVPINIVSGWGTLVGVEEMIAGFNN